jgi:hypothetical protein
MRDVRMLIAALVLPTTALVLVAGLAWLLL